MSLVHQNAALCGNGLKESVDNKSSMTKMTGTACEMEDIGTVCEMEQNGTK